jgi:uncharacterized membrane protein
LGEKGEETEMAAMLRTVAEVGSVVTIVAAWVMAIRAYPRLPAPFPIHFGFSGRPDSWGRKEWVWFMPAMSSAIYLFDRYLLSLVARDPRHPGMLVGVAWLYFEMLLMFLYIEARSIAVARGRAEGLGRAFVPVVIALIVATSLLLARG